ncbi:YjcZ family sporulation protein [Neobacillus drentensis]
MVLILLIVVLFILLINVGISFVKY